MKVPAIWSRKWQDKVPLQYMTKDTPISAVVHVASKMVPMDSDQESQVLSIIYVHNVNMLVVMSVMLLCSSIVSLYN